MPDAQGRYTLLALGDSVMWGQGLAAGHSFAQQVRDWLAHLKPHGATLASLARSGAILDATPRPFDGAARAPWLFGELPRSCPGIRTQAEIARGSAGYAGYLDADSWDPPAWATAKASVREQLAAYGSGGPNLILLDGGINDFNALQVVLPWKLGGPDRTCGGNSHSDAVERLLGAARAAGPGVAVTGRFDLPALEEMTDADFKQRIDRLVYGRMKPTLQRLQQIFPASQVIVTGYFPIFTPGSLEGLLTGSAGLAAGPLVAPGRAPQEIAAALLWALHPSLDRRAAANRFIEQSALWVTYGTKRLQDAVDEVNGNGPPRFFLARPGFGPDNGALAPDAWLWTFGGGLDDLVRLLLRLLGDLLPPDMAATTSREPLGALRTATSGTAFTVGYALGAGFATDEATAARWLGAFDYYVFSAAGQSDPQATLPSGVETSLASVGHPNPAGATAYVTAIQAAPIPPS